MSQEYWRETISEALDGLSIPITAKQLDGLAEVLDCAHRNYSLAYPTPENPLRFEVTTLRKELAVERDRVGCPACNGSGNEILNFGVRTSVSRCFTCSGSGKVSSGDRAEFIAKQRR